jgi:hypothetical protein
MWGKCVSFDFCIGFVDEFFIDDMHVEEVALSPTGIDNDHFIAEMVKMICDPLSSYFILHGVKIDDLRVILNKHGIQSNMSIELSRQTLCHHILSGHCVKADGEQSL